MIFASIFVGAVALGYGLLKLNRLWIHHVLDRALSNPRDSLPERYDLPRYLAHDEHGNVDPGKRWPGWDGWYFFVLPDEGCPLAMIRGSIMTGLYGLDGIDDYHELERAGQSSFRSVEYLNITIPREPAGAVHVWQEYLPRATALALTPHVLDLRVNHDSGERGRIRGAWPGYAIETTNPDIGLRGRLRASADRLVWWADAPGVFTYFAAFARFEGAVTMPDPATGELIEVPITGRGCIEHGCARKPFSFDGLWAPVRLLKRVFPRFRPVRYHYELFLDHAGPCARPSLQGGFMHARGFGIDIRNHGGAHIGDEYIPIHAVDIEYLRFQADTLVPHQWRVHARTDHGPLTYVATRVGPPAAITENMAYYHYTYEGAFRDQPIAGAGYGEYLHI